AVPGSSQRVMQTPDAPRISCPASLSSSQYCSAVQDVPPWMSQRSMHASVSASQISVCGSHESVPQPTSQNLVVVLQRSPLGQVTPVAVQSSAQRNVVSLQIFP